MTLKKSTSLMFVILMGGCASHTGVVPMGKDTFMIAKQQATGFPGLGNMKAEIIGEGSMYCSNQGKEFQIVKIDNDPDGSWVDYINVETGQEYSCRLEAFEARFHPVLN